MPKLDPNGEAPNPIRAKLAGDISRPWQVLPSSPTPVIHSVLMLPPQPAKSDEVEPGLSVRPPDVAVPVSDTEPLPSTKLAKPKKVLFTAAEQKENDAVIRRLADAVGAGTLGWSHVNRALWSLLRRAQELIEQRRPAAPRLARPSNGNPIELARFEDLLSQYLLALFKDVPRQPWT